MSNATTILRWAYAHLAFTTILTFTPPTRDIHVSASSAKWILQPFSSRLTPTSHISQFWHSPHQPETYISQLVGQNQSYNHSPVGLHPPRIYHNPDIHPTNPRHTCLSQSGYSAHHSPVGLHPPHISHKYQHLPNHPRRRRLSFAGLLCELTINFRSQP